MVTDQKPQSKFGVDFGVDNPNYSYSSYNPGQYATQAGDSNHIQRLPDGRIVKKKGKKGNAFLHLEKFTSVEQLKLFAPDIVIELENLDGQHNGVAW